MELLDCPKCGRSHFKAGYCTTHKPKPQGKYIYCDFCEWGKFLRRGRYIDHLIKYHWDRLGPIIDAGITALKLELKK